MTKYFFGETKSFIFPQCDALISREEVSLLINFTKYFLNEREFHVFPFCTVWKNEKFGLTEKIFRQIDSFVISLVKPLLSRDFRQKSVRVNFRNFHIVHSVEKWKIYSHWKKISSNQLFSNFFSKTVTFTRFSPKIVWEWISVKSTLCRLHSVKV